MCSSYIRPESSFKLTTCVCPFICFREGYDALDPGSGPLPPFRPCRPPGAHIPDTRTRDGVRNYLRPVDFFKLFFTACLVDTLCQYSNMYAAAVGPDKPSLFTDWYAINAEEFYRFCGLLMYMSLVKVPNVEKYWSRKTLYNGLWARSFMVKKRFKQIMSFMKISDIYHPNQDDRLDKARFLIEYIRRKCMKLFQPDQNICIDERMVKNKGRYGFRQYIRDKPTKWGMKLWVLADSVTGYTYDFDVYLGRNAKVSGFGLAYDVVMNLVKSLLNQGYHLFHDSFYTGVQLIRHLLTKGIRACGTVMTGRRGFPAELKNVKDFNKRANRGDVRWIREGEMLALQWKDNKTVSFLSTIHSVDGQRHVRRRSKVNGEFRDLWIRQPTLVSDYNTYMGGVDKSDQLINRYNVLRKTKKWWKTLFFHCLDIARVNAFILFQEYRKKHCDVEELKRSRRYGQADFTEELARELGNLPKEGSPPTIGKPVIFTSHSIIPVVTKERRNCKKCYKDNHVEIKTRTKCLTCDTYLCLQEDRNCLLDFHANP